jgi:hypothetical protein
MATQVMSKKVVIRGVLGSNIFRANEEYAEGNPYNAQIILERDEAKKLDDARKELLKEALGGKERAVKNHLLRKGDDEQYEQTFDKHFINCRSKKSVDCFLKHGSVLTKLSQEEATQYFYRGAHVALSLSVLYLPARVTANGKIPEQVVGKPIALVFVKHGERMGEDFLPAASDFEGFESEVTDDNKAVASQDITDADLDF